MNRFVIPVIVFLALMALLAFGLTRDPRTVSSPLINKPVPVFQTRQLLQPGLTISNKDLLGKVSLVNVWASWCAACRHEHPLLVSFARQRKINLYGLNYKDKRNNALRWLKQLGNPYRANITDPGGQIGIDWGVYGVPETFIIDKKGIIRYKKIGPITAKTLQKVIIPLLNKLEAE
jgi:cytochrome c biogenesis protein CcmG/thiol:disulfide interchange protein DsbE